VTANRWRKLLGGVAVVVAVIGVGVGLRLVAAPGHFGGGRDTPGGPFKLVNTAGETVTPARWRGRYKLVYFGYTYCPDVCPTALGIISRALDRLDPSVRARIVPVFITVDPARDTRKVMAEYVQHFHPALIGLTGTERQVRRAAEAYNVTHEKVPREEGPYLMDHSALTYLMGPEGAFIRQFPHGMAAKKMAAALRATVKQGAGS